MICHLTVEDHLVEAHFVGKPLSCILLRCDCRSVQVEQNESLMVGNHTPAFQVNGKQFLLCEPVWSIMNRMRSHRLPCTYQTIDLLCQHQLGCVQR